VEHPVPYDQLSPMADADLVRLAQAALGDGAAGRQTAQRCLGLVVARHRDLVRTVIAAKVPAAEVDDVESEVLLGFARTVYRGTRIQNPAGLLVRIARCARADFHSRRPPAASGLEEWDAAALDAALERLSDEEAVEDLLAPLSERQREILWQRIVEGRPSSEVASLHGTTAGNVDVIVHRCLARLREAMG
jgi:RNA polymerase sigma-70 factor, ECF subfamily